MLYITVNCSPPPELSDTFVLPQYILDNPAAAIYLHFSSNPEDVAWTLVRTDSGACMDNIPFIPRQYWRILM